ncbi:MAG: hypothetical protein CVU92_00890 [Firmicutes bacterium HGW-Firmicutes-17]|jgi:uncharacterized protein YjdB|nr:MAG: hypothetical protein CVU92_00890 [Firmicutes bacterium HGW-Firmicutes-17]
MKKRTASMLSAVLLTSVLLSPGVSAEGAQATVVTEPGVQYKTHIQDYGWETAWKINGALSGTEGESKRLEAMLVQLTGSLPEGASIQTYVHVQNRGDMGPFAMGNEAGTSGQSLRLESIRLVLNNMPGYRLLYNVQVQNKGWLKDNGNQDTWFKNGETAGTSGEGLRLEGIRVKLVEVNEEYESYLATVNAVVPSFYTSESWTIYKKVVDANQMTKDSSKEKIKQATANIAAAQKNLVLAKNLTAYNAALAAVKEEEYTPDTWAVYREVVEDNVVTKNDTQAKINEALNRILEAQKKLQWKVNLTEYRATLDAARAEDYTADSWVSYQKVLSTYAMTENNTQTEVDAAVKKIDEAQKKMVRKFDFTAYNALLNAVKEEDYIETTWTIYQDVVDANFVDETNTQSDIEKAIKKIEEAQSKLVKKADLTYYQAVLDAVNKEDYTTVSWNAYQKVVRSAVVNTLSKPEVIDAAVLKILNAQMSLMPAGDMRYYSAAINAVIRTDYTTPSWDTYQKVVEANVVIPVDGQEAIDAAIEKIEAAQKKLVPAAEDLKEYNELIGLDQDNYTSASWITYQKVIDANFLKAQDGQAKINAAVIKLRAASLKLVERAGYYKEYSKALKYNLYLGKDPDDTASTKPLVLMNQGEYTTSSWATYQKVLDTNVMDPDKSQAQVNTAVANIKKAQYKLLKGGILTEYENVLKFNLNRDPDGNILMKDTEYTSASWAIYQKVLDTNEMDRDKSQAQIDAAVVKIERAQQKLVLKGRLDLSKGYNETLAIVKEENFTEKSWEAYKKAIAAKGVYMTSDNSQAEIDRAVGYIIAAQNNLKKKGEISEYDLLVEKYLDQTAFKTQAWSDYQAVLNQYDMTSENTQSEINTAITKIKNAQTVLTMEQNRAAIMVEYNRILGLTDDQSAYTANSWSDYQKIVKDNYKTKDNSQTEVNAAATKIETAQAKLVRANGTELKAFKDAFEMYSRNIATKGSVEVKANPGTWDLYEQAIKRYADFNSDGSWKQTIITDNSRPGDIVFATLDIQKAIEGLIPDSSLSLDTAYSAYNTAITNAEKWDGSVASAYTKNSYNDYVVKCKEYEIKNRLESAPGVTMTELNINMATQMINLSQSILKDSAVGDVASAFQTEFNQFTKLVKDNYTSATWDTYQTLYTKTSLNIDENSKQEYEDATTKLKNAREALIAKASVVMSKSNITVSGLGTLGVTAGDGVSTNLIIKTKALIKAAGYDETDYTVTFVKKSGADIISIDAATYGQFTGAGSETVEITIKSTDSTDTSAVTSVNLTIGS